MHRSKQHWRKDIEQRIQALSPLEKRLQSRFVCDQLLVLMREKSVQTIVLYSALSDEIAIGTVFSFCLENHINILFPRVVDDSMELCKVISRDDLVIGSFGVKEPGGHIIDGYDGVIDMIVVPGRVFDLGGGRIGRGKGYYDKLLVQYPYVCKVGVCFQEQIITLVPADTWDIKMHVVVSGTSGF